MIILDLFSDLFATLVARLGPLPTRSRQIAAEGRRVEIPFVVGKRIVLAEPTEIHFIAVRHAGLNEAGHQFITIRVVLRRRGNGDHVRSIGRQTEPKAIRLHTRAPAVPLPRFAWVDQRQQST